MKYIECPQVYENTETSLFLAGGITNCHLWQNDLVGLLKNTNIVILNPRRKEFIMNHENEEEQIKWEFDHLNKAKIVSFWFTKETLCPITLFELGKILMTDKKVIIGIHPEYKRKRDLEIQARLIQPNIEVVYSLRELANKIIRHSLEGNFK